MFSLILAMLILGGVAWFWEDYTNYPYKIFGTAWWATAVFLGFALGILYYALFVLPIPGSEGWAEGLRLLTRNYLKPPDKAAPPARSRRKRKDAGGGEGTLSPSFKSLGCGILRSHQVLSLIKGGGFSRAAGPGFIILFKKESIRQMIDLRKHSRAGTVKANTRDGIPVEFLTFVDFQVWQTGDPIQPGSAVYQYEPDAVFRVSYVDNITDKQESLHWADVVLPLVVDQMIIEIGRYSLEELYATDADGRGPMDDIKQRVQHNLARNELLNGVEILSVGAGNFILRESMREQLIKQWQAQWKQRIKTTKARGNAEAELRLKHARARAQIDLIETITQSIINAQRDQGVALTEVIALRMIEAMEEAVSDVSVQALIPQPVLTSMVESSRQMLSWIEGDSA